MEASTSLRLGARERSLNLLLRCFAGSVGADRALLLSRDRDGGSRVRATWSREGREPTVAWTRGSLLGRAMAAGEALLEPEPDRNPASHTAVAAAVTAEDRVVGAIYGGFEPASRQPAAELVWCSRSYAAMAALCMSRDHTVPAVLGSIGVDALTGCLSYAGIFEALQAEFMRSQRRRHELAVCMLDIDDFKRINDGIGHVQGNRVLAAAGDGLRASARRYDAVGRFGGDEFLIALPETARDEATVAAERFRQSARSAVLEATAIEIDASVGVVEWAGEGTVSTLVEAADRTMREAKARGGGQVRSGPSAGRRRDGLARLTRHLVRPWDAEPRAARERSARSV